MPSASRRSCRAARSPRPTTDTPETARPTTGTTAQARETQPGSKPRIAVLGTGLMGAATARNVLRAGSPLAAWNRSRAKAEAIVGAVLAAMDRPVHVGPHSAGQLAKLGKQIIVGVTIGAVAEALMLAARGGADPAKVCEALHGGYAELDPRPARRADDRARLHHSGPLGHPPEGPCRCIQARPPRFPARPPAWPEPRLPRRNAYMRLRDELGTLFTNAQFTGDVPDLAARRCRAAVCAFYGGILDTFPNLGRYLEFLVGERTHDDSAELLAA